MEDIHEDLLGRRGSAIEQNETSKAKFNTGQTFSGGRSENSGRIFFRIFGHIFQRCNGILPFGGAVISFSRTHRVNMSVQSSTEGPTKLVERLFVRMELVPLACSSRFVSFRSQQLNSLRTVWSNGLLSGIFSKIRSYIWTGRRHAVTADIPRSVASFPTREIRVTGGRTRTDFQQLSETSNRHSCVHADFANYPVGKGRLDEKLRRVYHPPRL